MQLDIFDPASNIYHTENRREISLDLLILVNWKMENGIFDAPNYFNNMCYKFLKYCQTGLANAAPP